MIYCCDSNKLGSVGGGYVIRDFRGNVTEKIIFGKRTGEVWEQNM